MDTNKQTLLETIASGESSRLQFKADFKNANQLAAEMVAFANSGGGRILVGVTDDGLIAGLLAPDIGRLNQLISNVASQSVLPPINPSTENIRFDQGLVIIIEVPAGISKPHKDNQGAIWVKSGADKRKVTAREEMQRKFVRSPRFIFGNRLMKVNETEGRKAKQKADRINLTGFGILR